MSNLSYIKVGSGGSSNGKYKMTYIKNDVEKVTVKQPKQVSRSSAGRYDDEYVHPHLTNMYTGNLMCGSCGSSNVSICGNEVVCSRCNSAYNKCSGYKVSTCERIAKIIFGG